ncbi:MAG: hypothetical protein ACOC1K_08295 [Nanoarchaeota archaeon]
MMGFKDKLDKYLNEADKEEIEMAAETIAEKIVKFLDKNDKKYYDDVARVIKSAGFDDEYVNEIADNIIVFMENPKGEVAKAIANLATKEMSKSKYNK